MDSYNSTRLMAYLPNNSRRFASLLKGKHISREAKIGLICGGVILGVTLFLRVLTFWWSRRCRKSGSQVECSASGVFESEADFPTLGTRVYTRYPYESPIHIRIQHSPSFDGIAPSFLWLPTQLEQANLFQASQNVIQNSDPSIVRQVVDIPAPVVLDAHLSEMEISISQDLSQNDDSEYHMEESQIPPQANALLLNPINPAVEAAEEPGSEPESPTGGLLQCDAPDCGKSFTSQSVYSHHVRYHLKPHKCESCQRGFGTSKDLRRHINDVHETLKKYYCSISDCKYSRNAEEGSFFARRSNRRRHVREIHGREDEDSGDGGGEGRNGS